MSRKIKYLYILFSVLAVAFFRFYLQKDKVETIINEGADYPLLSKNSNDYCGTIIKRSMSGVYTGTYLFELSNGQKFSESGFLDVGDSIHRPANKDSLFIYREKGTKESKIYLYRDRK
ncbi:hypothetical protein [Dysgonomonas macrotermitis]|nr:hypothetical protein [Dysgonomonas macrotermitis]